MGVLSGHRHGEARVQLNSSQFCPGHVDRQEGAELLSATCSDPVSALENRRLVLWSHCCTGCSLEHGACPTEGPTHPSSSSHCGVTEANFPEAVAREATLRKPHWEPGSVSSSQAFGSVAWKLLEVARDFWHPGSAGGTQDSLGCQGLAFEFLK